MTLRPFFHMVSGAVAWMEAVVEAEDDMEVWRGKRRDRRVREKRWLGEVEEKEMVGKEEGEDWSHRRPKAEMDVIYARIERAGKRTCRALQG